MKSVLTDTVLQVRNLKTHFKSDNGVLKAVDGISFDVHKGETLGIVGESGSGKSVTTLSIIRLIPSLAGRIVSGSITFNGKDLLAASEQEMRMIRGNKISMIFQDPMTSLNPFLRISTQMIETIRLHQGLNTRLAHAQAIEMLSMVGISHPEKRINNYPHQFSGGMRQRVMIAMALSCKPDILIADEPTTALDVTIQAQILDIIRRLAEEIGTAVILITHDLGIIANMCSRVMVMYAGKIVETGIVDKIFANPLHPYTRGLIASVPRLDKARDERLYLIPGQPPVVINLPDCCPFAPRCQNAMDICSMQAPPTVSFGENSRVSCWLYDTEKKGGSRV